MLGLSIFLNQDFSEERLQEIEQHFSKGICGIFTSLHIPEEDARLYKKRLTALGKICKPYQINLMADISGGSLEKAGLCLADLEEMGVTGLRMDDNISMKEVAKASQKMKIALNASTLTREEVEELKKYQANFKHLEAWHNYYPRKETGLSLEVLYQKNVFLKSLGLKVVAFIAGNSALRGPLYQGLPTVESHRNLHPLASFLSLKNEGVEDIYVGDSGLTSEVWQQFASYFEQKEIFLYAEKTSKYFSLVEREHYNRMDEAELVVRSREARFWELPVIEPEKSLPRKKGAITIDNERYGRYMGEIQVAKRDLGEEKKTNVVGYVREEDLALIDFIRAGDRWKIGERTDEKNEFREPYDREKK